MPLSPLLLPKHWTSISTNSIELDHRGRVLKYLQPLALPTRTPPPPSIIATQLRSFSTSCLTQHCRRESLGPHIGFTKMKRRQNVCSLISPLVTGGGTFKYALLIYAYALRLGLPLSDRPNCLWGLLFFRFF